MASKGRDVERSQLGNPYVGYKERRPWRGACERYVRGGGKGKPERALVEGIVSQRSWRGWFPGLGF